MKRMRVAKGWPGLGDMVLASALCPATCTEPDGRNEFSGEGELGWDDSGGTDTAVVTMSFRGKGC